MTMLKTTTGVENFLYKKARAGYVEYWFVVLPVFDVHDASYCLFLMCTMPPTLKVLW